MLAAMNSHSSSVNSASEQLESAGKQLAYLTPMIESDDTLTEQMRARLLLHFRQQEQRVSLALIKVMEAMALIVSQFSREDMLDASEAMMVKKEANLQKMRELSDTAKQVADKAHDLRISLDQQKYRLLHNPLEFESPFSLERKTLSQANVAAFNHIRKTHPVKRRLHLAGWGPARHETRKLLFEHETVKTVKTKLSMP